MDHFPKIEINRLQLSKIIYSDIPKIIEYAGNEKVAETTLNIPHPYQEQDAIFWINSANQGYKHKNQYTFGIKLKPTYEFIGGIGLKLNLRFNRAVLGYWIAEPFWNNGYATEAVRAVLKFGFMTLEVNKIFAHHLVENPASGKVMMKNNMIREGLLKEHTKKGDIYRSIIQYRLTKKEYNKTEQNNV